MHLARDILLAVAGTYLVVITLVSVVRSTILPRGVRSPIAGFVYGTTRLLFRLRAGRSATYARRDRVMAMYGPVALLLLLSTWYLLLIVAFTALFLATGVPSLEDAFKVSGSAVFTLGTSVSPKLGPDVLTYVEAGLGLLVLTLLITYLPTMYSVFSSRESAVARLQVRAGTPPTATTLLIRYYRIGLTGRLSELWQQWEEWFAALEESHTSFPIIGFFRSPQPDQSWVTAAGTVLDGASLWASSIEHPNDPDVQLCIRAGFVALRRLASFFNLSYEGDPDPSDPITISRQEYDDACQTLADAGLPLRADRDAAWQAFRGWRVNYDTVLLNLARLMEAPIAPWTSDRSPLGGEKQWSWRRVFRLGRSTDSPQWWRRRDASEG
ncbi:MAG TPA: hypothetical protein VHT30_10300 [Acidimicrobiales bacterium]|jgi:hypothetical protein|nr:hypothetical protein [Acidimicrobiales bacterium]